MAKLGGVANGQLFRVTLKVEVHAFSLGRTEDRCESCLKIRSKSNDDFAVFRELNTVSHKREFNVEADISGGSTSFLSINASETKVDRKSFPGTCVTNPCST